MDEDKKKQEQAYKLKLKEQKDKEKEVFKKLSNTHFIQFYLSWSLVVIITFYIDKMIKLL